MFPEEFTRLAGKYGDTVFRVALNCLRDWADAEDAAQTALLRLLQTEKDFASDEHVKRWLIRVTVNECRKLLRSPWRRRIQPLEEQADAPIFPDEEHQELFEAVMALPAKYRVIIYLYYYEDYSVEEMSQALGRKVSTIQTQLARGRGLLKKALKEEADDE